MEKNTRQAYLIGGGIASLAAAAYLIRDGNFDGKNIHIFDEVEKFGGSLDGKGSLETGYIIRGIRLFSEKVYDCMLDLFSFIPLSQDSSKTLLDDFIDFNAKVRLNAKARLVRNGRIVDSTDLGLSVADMLRLIKITSFPESFLGNSTISDHFSLSFFKTNFWFICCTTFSFQPWHSAAEFRRYILRSIQEFHKMSSMVDGRHTRYNQYDSIVVPLSDWLNGHGVDFMTESRVSSLEFIKDNGKEQVGKIVYSQKGKRTNLSLGRDDLVFLTNGSMTTDSTFGSMTSAPKMETDIANNGPWALWKDISAGRPHFGNPNVFCDHVDKSKWESFSVTFRDSTFLDLMENFSKNKPGTGGGTTLRDSSWIMSIILPHQPHFMNQPSSVYVLWGYCLRVDKVGDYVHKKMSECNGEEILIELCSHLGFTKKLPDILRSANCVPCVMPYITSQFLPRSEGDRPSVIPKNTRNFAFIGQFSEVPNEIVFTVEQSVRSAMTAVRGLLGIKKKIPPIYKGPYFKEIIKESFRVVFRSR